MVFGCLGGCVVLLVLGVGEGTWGERGGRLKRRGGGGGRRRGGGRKRGGGGWEGRRGGRGG